MASDIPVVCSHTTRMPCGPSSHAHWRQRLSMASKVTPVPPTFGMALRAVVAVIARITPDPCLTMCRAADRAAPSVDHGVLVLEKHSILLCVGFGIIRIKTVFEDSMDPKRVIRSYLVISGLFTLSASLIWGINTLFLLDAGLSIFEVFVANAAFTAAMALFEIPTGVVADTRGRRASFLLSEATLAVGTLAYVGVAVIHGGLALFCLAGVVLGLGYTFYSGAVEAWLVDALKATGYRHELDGVFAKASIVASVAMIVGTVGGGLLGQIDLSLPYIARTALVLMAFAVGYRTMHEIGFTPRALRFQGVVGEMRN